MTTLIETIESWIAYCADLKSPGLSIGFVPTMGALHEGHLELIRRARQETDWVVVSIFLNPTQFNDAGDFDKYPKSLDRDRALASEAGADVIFTPQKEELYLDNFNYKVCEADFSNSFEGENRPGHFDGVLTIVMKLLNLVQPDRAYFGEKDYQQLKLVEEMVKAFFMKIQIIPVSTVREPDGLAMSSRNALLTPQGRKQAPEFHHSLTINPTADEARSALVSKGIKVEYVEDYKDRRLGAVVIDNVRLIDNVSIKNFI